MKTDKKPSVFSGICYTLLFTTFNFILPVTIIFTTIGNFVTPYYAHIAHYLIPFVSVNVLFAFVLRYMLNGRPVKLGVKIPLFILTSLTFILFVIGLTGIF